MDLQHGLLMGFIGCTVNFLGFLIVFLVINYNIKKDKEKKEFNKGPMYDLNKNMPGWKGDDCQ